MTSGPVATRKPTRAAIYCRISLDRSGERLGVERQAEQCRELAGRLGWELKPGKPYEDNDISASSGKLRRNWERLLEDIRTGEVDGLLAWHLDRLLRRLKDLTALLDALQAAPRPVQVAFVQVGEIDLNTPSGRLLATILAGVAANESELKGARVRAARQQEAHSGKAHTLLGYGYNDDRTINPAEQAVVLEVKDRLLAEHSLLSIAKDLNARGVPTPGAGKWTARHVVRSARLDETPAALKALIAVLLEPRPIAPAQAARLINAAGGVQVDGTPWRAEALRKEQQLAALLASDLRDDTMTARVLASTGVPTERMYWRAANLQAMIRRGSLCGWREFSPGKRGGRGELVAEGDWTPILTKHETEAIRRITDRTTPTPGGRTPQHLLTGVVRCGRCGAKMGGHTDKKTGVARYGCAQQPGLPDRCGKTGVIAKPVDERITALVIDVLADSDFRAGKRHKSQKASPDVAKVEARLESLHADLRAYTQDAAAGALSRDEYLTLRDGLNAQIRQAERELGSQSLSVKHSLRDVPTERPAIEEWWEEVSLDRRRETVLALIEEVRIAPVGKASNRFDPARIGDPKWRL